MGDLRGRRKNGASAVSGKYNFEAHQTMCGAKLHYTPLPQLLQSSSLAVQSSPCKTFQKALSLFFRLWFSWRLLLITAGAGSSWGCLCSAGSLWFVNTFHLIQQWWWCAGMMWQQLFICCVGFSPPRLPRALKSGHREGCWHLYISIKSSCCFWRNSNSSIVISAVISFLTLTLIDLEAMNLFHEI